VQVKVFEQSAACSSGEALCVLRVSMPVFPPRGNPLQMGFQPRIFEVIRLLLTFRRPRKPLPAFSSNLRFLIVITSDYRSMRCSLAPDGQPDG
jgi:hypothetical protein